MDYSRYEHLLFERRDDGVLLITINRPDKYNATNERLHWELSRVWLDVSDDDETRVAVVTGAGKAFSAGGDLDMIERQAGDFRAVAGIMREAGDIVYNIAGCEKPVISAINGALAIPHSSGQMMAAWSPAPTPSRRWPSVSRASSAMMLMSAMSATARPAPTATPLIAEITGFSQPAML